jgi:hypothetical protein
MTLKWRGTDQNRRNLKKAMFDCHFIHNESYMKSLGIKLKAGEILAPNCLSYNMEFKLFHYFVNPCVLLNFRVPKLGLRTRLESTTLMEYGLGLLDLLCYTRLWICTLNSCCFEVAIYENTVESEHATGRHMTPGV